MFQKGAKYATEPTLVQKACKQDEKMVWCLRFGELLYTVLSENLCGVNGETPRFIPCSGCGAAAKLLQEYK